jgi:hypothetical protein
MPLYSARTIVWALSHPGRDLGHDDFLFIKIETHRPFSSHQVNKQRIPRMRRTHGDLDQGLQRKDTTAASLRNPFRGAPSTQAACTLKLPATTLRHLRSLTIHRQCENALPTAQQSSLSGHACNRWPLNASTASTHPRVPRPHRARQRNPLQILAFRGRRLGLDQGIDQRLEVDRQIGRRQKTRDRSCCE